MTENEAKKILRLGDPVKICWDGTKGTFSEKAVITSINSYSVCFRTEQGGTYEKNLSILGRKPHFIQLNVIKYLKRIKQLNA